MKKRFVTKRKKRKFKFFLFLFIFFYSLYNTYCYLDKLDININNKKLVEYILSSYGNDKVFIKDIFLNIKNNSSLVKLLNNNYNRISNKSVSSNKNNNDKQLIYIYNTHQTEEYSNNSFIPYSINPTVMVVDYILEKEFNDNGFYTKVEENSIKDILNNNNWNYSYSYKASRILMENEFRNNNNLKYFIDVHRDSLSRDKTTIKINDKNYARIIFIVGLENSNYLDNLDFTTKINNKINELYPNLSKGIYEKGGKGVNGLYNQDFSKYVILIEVGGYENTMEEVLNTSLAFSKCFMEVIKNEE